MTTVLELNTGREITYDLCPMKAVVCAYYQFGIKSSNTWQYNFFVAKLSTTGKTWYCGNYTAINKLYLK